MTILSLSFYLNNKKSLQAKNKRNVYTREVWYRLDLGTINITPCNNMIWIGKGMILILKWTILILKWTILNS